MIDTFSANSLKILDKSLEDFEKKYIHNLEFYKTDENAQIGNKFHNLICYYLKNYDVQKFESALNKGELEIWEKTKNSSLFDFIKSADEKFIEQPFFIKENFNGKDFYLTGRFDAVIKKGEEFTILDWKTRKIPACVESEIQTVVYIFCASKLFKSKNIKMVYYSLEEEKEAGADYREDYFDKIIKIISKIY